jgi:hypothetical protein
VSCNVRSYYLTQNLFTGANALTACEPGFHMASLWEIFDTSNLQYDTTRGYTRADSGNGPPQNDDDLGWVRTGNIAGSGFTRPGLANCSAWTSPDGFGSAVASSTCGSAGVPLTHGIRG